MGLGHCGGLERGSGADDGFAAESFALSAVAAQELGSPPDGVGAVEVAPDGGAEAGARGAAGLFGDLEAGAVPGEGVDLFRRTRRNTDKGKIKDRAILRSED